MDCCRSVFCNSPVGFVAQHPLGNLRQSVFIPGKAPGIFDTAESTRHLRGSPVPAARCRQFQLGYDLGGWICS